MLFGPPQINQVIRPGLFDILMFRPLFTRKGGNDFGNVVPAEPGDTLVTDTGIDIVTDDGSQIEVQ